MKIIVFSTIAFLCLKVADCIPHRRHRHRRLDHLGNGTEHTANMSACAKFVQNICKERNAESLPTCSAAKKILTSWFGPDVSFKSERLKREDTPNIKNDDKEAPVDSPLLKCGDGEIPVRSYVFVIIGVIMLLMLIVIVCLSVLLYRTKLREYKVFASPATPNATVNNTDIRGYITQTSQEMSLLNINSMQDSKQQTFKESSSRNDLFPNDGKDNDFIESIPQPQNALKIYKSVRKPVDHQMILREQMKKICDDALARSQNSGITASLKDLNHLLNDFDYDKREKSNENITREKSASFPQLDIYDAPPARNIPVDGNEVDAPVYECLPTSNNIVIEDYDTKYLMALSKENLAEPSYINAKYRYN